MLLYGKKDNFNELINEAKKVGVNKLITYSNDALTEIP
jgi:hypothetical protein